MPIKNAAEAAFFIGLFKVETTQLHEAFSV